MWVHMELVEMKQSCIYTIWLYSDAQFHHTSFFSIIENVAFRLYLRNFAFFLLYITVVSWTRLLFKRINYGSSKTVPGVRVLLNFRSNREPFYYMKMRDITFPVMKKRAVMHLKDLTKLFILCYFYNFIQTLSRVQCTKMKRTL